MKLVFFIIFLISCGTFAQPAVQKSTAKVSRAKPKEIPAKAWGIGFGYSAAANLANENENRTYEHTANAEFNYELGKLWAGEYGISVGSGFIYYSDGNNIRNENTNPAWNDISVGVSYGQKLFSDSKLVLALAESLPTGYESQTEGYKSVIDTSASLSTSFLDKKLMVVNAISFSAIFNTLDESEFTFESNPDHVSTYSLGLNYILAAGFSIGAKLAAKNVHFINNENQLRTSTSEYIRYKTSSWSISLSYLLGNYDENDSYRFLYLDDTRRMFKLGVNFEI